MHITNSRNLIFGLLAFALGLLVFLLVTGLYAINTSHALARDSHNLARKNQAYISCVINWANKSTERTNSLVGLAQKRQHAFDTVFLDFSAARNQHPTPAQQAALRKKFFHDFDRWKRATHTYNKAFKQHPVPKSPKLACANLKK